MPAEASSNVHTGTPSMMVSDARGLMVRTVQLHRREAADPVATRVTHQHFDAMGRLAASRDPWLFELAQTDDTVPANLSQIMSLSGAVVSTDSVDAGWRVVLPGEAGQLVERWDGRGSHSLSEYDELVRLVTVRESGRAVAEHTLERFTYAGVGTEYAARNLCGQLIRHDDPAGTVRVRDLGLFGSVLKQTRQFLISTEPPDWPASVAERDALLESGDGATTSYEFAPTTEPLQQIDALGNVQAFAYTVAGQLKNTRLTLAGDGQTEKVLVNAIHYNATGQIESETAGNGVIIRHRYDEADGRLTQLSAHKADGSPLQDLNYRYDAVGNVRSIEDVAQPIRYFNNQRIEPIKTYRYDTLYQLIYATGCEAKTGRGGPALPDFQSLSLDPGQIANYNQTFHYDAGGNLFRLAHVGSQAHSRVLTRSRYSNRCLPDRDNRPPTEEELAAGFDANGNLCELQAGQLLSWDLRNQLGKVCPVVREDKEDDCECYCYDGDGQRVRKVHSGQTSARTVIREVRYLPGLEIRSHSGTGEMLHVITASAGSNSVQVLHWVSKLPDEVVQGQVRYNLNDHLKSSALELDQNADLISQEWYYPFGGTAYWAGRNATEAKYKTVRYSGKERDATGLYYYGFRYYTPWLQRWINPDPAGYVDGMNLFSMVGNGPITYGDPDGHAGENLTQKQIDTMAAEIRVDGEDLPEQQLEDVIKKYLTKKGVDPNRYIEIIKAAAGVKTSATIYHRALSEEEKEGIHLFWSTNAGSKYINGITRNYIQNTSNNTIDFKNANKAAYKELKSNLGTAGTIKLNAKKEKHYLAAVELLGSHKDDPRRTILLVKAALGKVSNKEIFRGARLRNAYFKAGEIVETSGFTSFTPDEPTAIEFSTDKYHDASFAEGTFPVVFVTKGAHSLNEGLSEVEKIFPPNTQFSVTKTTSFKGKSYVWLEKRAYESGGRNRWI